MFFPQRVKLGLRKEKMLSSESVPFQESKRREFIMKNNNQINVPQAREAMDKFKMQAASEEDVFSTS